MDTLLNPDSGLVIWTIVTFLSLVFLLQKFAWGPLLGAIEERESKMKADLDGARAARDQAQAIKTDLEAQLTKVEAKSRDLLAQAAKDGDTLRASLKAAAEADAQKIRDKTMAELGEEKRRLVGELRKEVVELSVMAAEKLVRKSVDDGVQKSVLDAFFKDLEGKKVNN